MYWRKDKPPKGMRVLVSCEGFVGEAYISADGIWYRYYGMPLKSIVDSDKIWWRPLPRGKS